MSLIEIICQILQFLFCFKREFFVIEIFLIEKILKENNYFRRLFQKRIYCFKKYFKRENFNRILLQPQK